MTQDQSGSKERDEKYMQKLEWLKKWGNFSTNDDVSMYPWCVVDVVTIMEEYSTALEHKLSVAIAALEFYANKESWESLDKSRSSGNQCYDISLFDFDRNLEKKKDYAGSRARAALSTIKGAKTDE